MALTALKSDFEISPPRSNDEEDAFMAQFIRIQFTVFVALIGTTRDRTSVAERFNMYLLRAVDPLMSAEERVRYLGKMNRILGAMK